MKRNYFQWKRLNQQKFQNIKNSLLKSLFQQVEEDEVLKKYSPDTTNYKKPIDRQYFFNILNSHYPNYVKQLIEHAQSQRNSPELNEEKKQYILISDDWYDKLMSHPFISSIFSMVNSLSQLEKSGRTVQLLKESTKIFKGRQQTQPKDIGISLKRFKTMEKDQNITSKPQMPQSQFFMNEQYDQEQSEEQSPEYKLKFKI